MNGATQRSHRFYKTRPAFTLAELLIALAILGVIATFTIPKVLQAQQSEQSNSIAKESAGAISQALVMYKAANQITSGTGMVELTPYLNYVSRVTNITIDHHNTLNAIDCSGATIYCYRLHNGAILWFDDNAWSEFGGTSTTHGMYFQVDPDGVYGGSTTGPSKAVSFFIYTTGKLRTTETIDPGSASGAGAAGAGPGEDPDYFSWN